MVKKKHDNKDIEEKASQGKKCEDVAAVTREFEDIIRTKKKNIIQIAHQQGNLKSLKKERSSFLWKRNLESGNRPLHLKRILLSC